jgi:hypothetical protein
MGEIMADRGVLNAQRPPKTKAPQTLSSHGTLLRSISPPPKAALNHLTLCSAWPQLPVVTRFVLPKVRQLAANMLRYYDAVRIDLWDEKSVHFFGRTLVHPLRYAAFA